jgi:hypothetical protein
MIEGNPRKRRASSRGKVVFAVAVAVVVGAVVALVITMLALPDNVEFAPENAPIGSELSISQAIAVADDLGKTNFGVSSAGEFGGVYSATRAAKMSAEEAASFQQRQSRLMEAILLGLSRPEDLEAANYLPALTTDDAVLALHFVTVCASDSTLDAYDLVESGEAEDERQMAQAQNLVRFCDAFAPVSHEDWAEWQERLLRWLNTVEDAADSGDRFAQYAYWKTLGDFIQASPDYLLSFPHEYAERRDQAMQWLLSLAAHGNDAAIWEAGMAFEFGRMVPKDKAMAYFINYHAVYRYGPNERFEGVLDELRGSLTQEQQQAIEAQVHALANS